MNIVITVLRHIYFLIELLCFFMLIRVLSMDGSGNIGSFFALIFLFTVYQPMVFFHLVYLATKLLSYKEPLATIDIIHIVYLCILAIMYIILNIVSVLN